MSRADKITPLTKIPEYYADFTRNLDTNKVTGQLERITNADAVKQSIEALILTDVKERFYQPHLGSNVQESLFGLADDPLSLETIRDSITNCIKQNEPRAALINVEVKPYPDQNGYVVNIMFGIINIQQTFVTTVIISRVR